MIGLLVAVVISLVAFVVQTVRLYNKHEEGMKNWDEQERDKEDFRASAHDWLKLYIESENLLRDADIKLRSVPYLVDVLITDKRMPYELRGRESINTSRFCSESDAIRWMGMHEYAKLYKDDVLIVSRSNGVSVVESPKDVAEYERLRTIVDDTKARKPTRTGRVK